MGTATLQVGLVGCGGIARQLHLPVLSRMRDRFELRAVCDADEARARQVGEQYGAAWYTSLEAMLAGEPDLAVVDVCTWMWTHQLVAVAAARAGKHVLVEKPLALTLPWADEIIAACAEGGVQLEVAENYPRWPNDRVIGRAVAQGVLGRLLAVYSSTPLHPFALDFNIHRVSQLLAVVDSAPVRVQAVMRPQSALPLPGPEHDLHQFGDPRSRHWGVATVEFANEVLGVVEGPHRGFPGGGSPRRLSGEAGTLLDSFAPTGELGLYTAEAGDKPWASHTDRITVERQTVEQNGRAAAYLGRRFIVLLRGWLAAGSATAARGDHSGRVPDPARCAKGEAGAWSSG